MGAVQVDSKYRVTIPKEARENIKPGDVLFVEEMNGVLHYAKAENPFDGLARHAIQEYRAGWTRSLAVIAQEEGIVLDGEEDGAAGEGRADGVGHSAPVRRTAHTAG